MKKKNPDHFKKKNIYPNQDFALGFLLLSYSRL